MLRSHFAAVLRNPIGCSDEATDAVFPYCVGFLVGVFSTAIVIAVLLLNV